MNAGIRFQAIVLIAFAWGLSPICAEPDHLEPIDPYDRFGDGYHKLVSDTLLGHRQLECWMVCRPSFRPEYAVMLHREEIDDINSDPFSQGQKYHWYLETAQATHQIWHWKELPKGKLQLDLLKNVKVERKKIEVTEAFGQAILQSWTAALRLTRYAGESNQGFDGENYDFSSQSYQGTTWSPTSGIPADLVKLASQLQTLVNSDSERRSTLQKEAFESARKLLDHAQWEGQKLSTIERMLNAGRLQFPPPPPSSR
jgi:hypothetical protein